MYLKTIMLIDDDLDDRGLFCHTVSEISPEIECLQFSKYKHALEYLRTVPKYPDIVFVGISPHLYDSSDFILEIKNDVRTNHIPIYIYSTQFLFEHLEDEVKAEVEGHVFKSTDCKEMRYNISNILKNDK